MIEGKPIFRKSAKEQLLSLAMLFFGIPIFGMSILCLFISNPINSIIPLIVSSALIYKGKKILFKSMKEVREEQKEIDDFYADVAYKKHAILQHNYEKAMRERDEALSKLNEPVKSNEKEF